MESALPQVIRRQLTLPTAPSWFLTWVLLGALATCWLVFTLYTLSFPLKINTDAANYLTGAESLVAGRGYSSYNPAYTSAANVYTPETHFQPGFPLLVAGWMGLTGQTSRVAAAWVNGLCWAVFYLLWLNVFRLQFGLRSWAFLFSAFLLVFSMELLGFLDKAKSEVVYMAVMAAAVNALLYAYQTAPARRSWRWTATAGGLASLLVVTRLSGLGMVLGLGLFLLLFLRGEAFPRLLLRGMLFAGSAAVGIAALFYRNAQYAAAPIGRADFAFSLDRTREIINIFFVSAFRLPTALEPYAFLLLIPCTALVVMAVIGTLRHHSSPLSQPVVILMLCLLLPYVAMIVYVGQDPSFNRGSGFMRYFNALPPLLTSILVAGVLTYRPRLQLNFAAVMGIFVAAVLLVQTQAAFGRTLYFLRALPESAQPPDVYQAIRQEVLPTEAVLLSNVAAVVAYELSVPARHVDSGQDVVRLVGSGGQSSKEHYLLLSKTVGVGFRLGAPTWQQVLAPLAYETVYEDQKHILVKLVP